MKWQRYSSVDRKNGQSPPTAQLVTKFAKIQLLFLTSRIACLCYPYFIWFCQKTSLLRSASIALGGLEFKLKFQLVASGFYPQKVGVYYFGRWQISFRREEHLLREFFKLTKYCLCKTLIGSYGKLFRYVTSCSYYVHSTV